MSSRAYRGCGCQVGITEDVDVKSGLPRMWMSSRAYRGCGCQVGLTDDVDVKPGFQRM